MPFSYYKPLFLLSGSSTLLLLLSSLSSISSCFSSSVEIINEIPGTEAQDIGKDLNFNFSSVPSGPIIKPSRLDKREYRGLVLDNGMKVILVSDPNTTRSASALTVGAGSMSDPQDILGLSHFMEHMIFLGNEKYKEENGFQRFLSEHGGYINAATQPDRTYYFYRVDNNALESSLEQFAAMFIAPLFSESAIEREVNSVESEHQKYFSNDKRRIERVEAQTGRKGHPFTFYRTGTIETLWERPRKAGLNVRTALVEQHLSFHSGQMMFLTVLGKESLDSLQRIVETCGFLEIPRRNTNDLVPEEEDQGEEVGGIPSFIPPYGEQELGERIDVVPLGNLRNLQIVFPIDYVKEYYRTTPISYISHVLGHEESGSLAAHLKRKEWAESVAVGPYRPGRGFGFFKVNVDLTQEGFKNVEDVVKEVFQYLGMVKEVGPQKWLWEEIRDITKLHLTYKDEPYPLDLVTKISTHLPEFPMEKVLLANGVDPQAEFDPVAITRVLNHFQPRNCRLILAAKEFQNISEGEFETEEFYGVKFRRRRIEDEVMQSWSEVRGKTSYFHFPSPNEFIPTDLELKKPRDAQSVEDPNTPRKLVVEEEKGDDNRGGGLSDIWYLQDNVFLLPKAVVTVEILSPLPSLDPVRTNLLLIWSTILTNSVWEFKYTAKLAGLESTVTPKFTGIEITVYGYNHKLSLFLSKLLEKVVSLSFSPSAFQVAKATLIKELRNVVYHAPCVENLDQTLLYTFQEKKWSHKELLEVLEGNGGDQVSEKRMHRFMEELLSRIRLNWLCYGNLTPQECLTIVQNGETLFNETQPLFESEIRVGKTRTIELPQGSNFLLKENQGKNTSSSSSSCTSVIFQIGLDTTRNSILTQLLTRITHQLAFEQLRTKEQLGYSAGADLLMVDKGMNVLAFRILVQSENANASYVEERIDSFLRNFGEVYLSNLTQGGFNRHKNSLRVVKSTPPKSMEDRAGSLRREIFASERQNFERRRVELEALNRLELPELQKFFNETVLNPNTRRRLAVHVIPNEANKTSGLQEDESEIKIIKDINRWKRKMKLYPSLNPFDENP